MTKATLVGNTHLVAGGPEVVDAVAALLEREGVETHANPDLYVRTYQHFGVDEARELRERAVLRPVGERRIFILAMPHMTNEAQNALLKTLEEPPAGALFFFILPAPESLLPTLRSRAHVLRLESAAAALSDAQAFLAASAQKRLDILKPLLERDDDEKRDMTAIIAFLGALERVLARAGGHRGLHAVYRARRYISDKGALVKPLLEQVALLVPKV